MFGAGDAFDALVGLALMWIVLPLSAVVAAVLAFRALRAAPNWGQLFVAAVCLTSPYLLLLGALGPRGLAFAVAAMSEGDISVVSPVAGAVIILATVVRAAAATRKTRP